jgi:hypothetical protein
MAVLMDELQAAQWRIRQMEMDRQRARQQQAAASWGSSNLGDMTRRSAYDDLMDAWNMMRPDGPSIPDKPKPVPAKPTTEMLETMEFALAGEGGRVDLALEVEDLLGYNVLRKDAKAPSRMERVLQSLEIDCYKQEKVDEYKKKMQAHFQAKAENEDRLEIQKTGFSRKVTVVSWKMVRLDKYTKPVPEHVLRKCVQIKRAAPDAEFFVDELVEEKRTLDPFMVVKLGEDKAVFEVWDEPEFEE